jgi:hypothetical protein
MLAALATIALLATSVLAQESLGGGRSSRNRGPEMPSLGGPPLYLSGEVTQIDTTRRAIQVRTKQNNKTAVIGFALDPKCKIKADKKEFGKKELELAEIEAGYQVELTIRQVDRQIIEMKAKKPKEAPSKEQPSAPSSQRP